MKKSFDLQTLLVGTLFFYSLSFMWYTLQNPDDRLTWLPYMGLPLFLMTLVLITHGKQYEKKRMQKIVLSLIIGLLVFIIGIAAPIPGAYSFCHASWCSALSLRPVSFWTGIYVCLALLIPLLGALKTSRTNMLLMFLIVCLGGTILFLL